MLPQLNWKEIEFYSRKILPELQGMFVDRIIIPWRGDLLGITASPFLKDEWEIRFSKRQSNQVKESTLLMSVRGNAPYFAWSPNKGHKAHSLATRSSLLLLLSKTLKGAQLLEIETISQDRIVIFWFSHSQKDKKYGLVLIMIPARPEALLVESLIENPEKNWKILESNREKKESYFSLFQNHTAPQNISCRQELFDPVFSFYDFIEKELQREAFKLKSLQLNKFFTDSIKNLESKFKKSLEIEISAEKEKDWKHLADLLKMALSQNVLPTGPQGNLIQFLNYETDQMIELKIDPHVPLKNLVEQFYQNAQKKKRRLEEITQRKKNTFENLEVFKSLNNKLKNAQNISELDQIFKAAGLNQDQSVNSKHQSSLIGKFFHSSEGLRISVGRDRIENMELTFKIARGNDLWMHVRGKPGAHVIIHLPQGKSASLETLLDAAHLTIYYSQGENWGKTEVDYTHKKYVKRIKDSTEVNYSNNKTLIIQFDKKRVEHLKNNALL